MGDGDRERVSGVGGLRVGVEAEKDADHRLHLAFVAAAVAGDGRLYRGRGIERDLEAGPGRGNDSSGAGLTDGEGGGRLDGADEGLLDRHLSGGVFGDDRRDRVVEMQEAT